MNSKYSDRYKLLKIFENTNIQIEEYSEYNQPSNYYVTNQLGHIIKISISKINNIPLGLHDLKYLKVLELSGNSIKDIPEDVLKFENDITINLTKNKIESISEEILESEFVFIIGDNKEKGRKKIVLYGNPIFYPPIEIMSQGKKSIINYLKEKEKGIDYLYELKVLLVGEGRVGKTSLMKSLINSDYILEDIQSTEGINIGSMVIKKSEFEPIISESHYAELKKDFNINLWDFGGQEIYHTTHQFFLTKRSLYILVTESRKEDKPEDFYYWLNIIKILGGQSPILLVLNKCDQPTKEIPINEYKSIFPNIIGSVEKVSCKHEYKSTLVSLKHSIMRIISNSGFLPHIGTPLPKVWILVRQDLEREKKSGKNFMTKTNYLEICMIRFKQQLSVGKKKMYNYEERALKLAEYFHDLGVILYFQNDFWLRDIVFLNNEWVTQAVYKILDNQIVKQNKGLFTEDNVLEIWSGKEYDNTRKELLALMKNREFDICFEISSGRYLAPQLFQIDKPESVEIKNIEEYPYNKTLYFEYHYPFKPKGILSRFIVKQHLYILSNVFWRYGLIIQYGDTKALIIEPPLDKKIVIRIIGPNMQSLADKIRDTFNSIHDDFPDLKVKELIPCTCKVCKDSKAHLYDIKDLFLRLEKKKHTIECPLSYEIENVKTIVSNSTNKKLPTIGEEMFDAVPKKIFISYSHSDVEWLVILQKHLKVLEKIGIKVDIWSDKNIKAGMKWREEIEISLNTSNIAILLISTEFLISDFISENELPYLLQKALKNEIVLLPLIIEDTLIEEFDFISDIQGINAFNKPIIEASKNEQNKIFINLVKRVKEIIKQ